jgi:hypothetical protein
VERPNVGGDSARAGSKPFHFDANHLCAMDLASAVDVGVTRAFEICLGKIVPSSKARRIVSAAQQLFQKFKLLWQLRRFFPNLTLSQTLGCLFGPTFGTMDGGESPKASAAYASAREYFSAGMALWDEKDWGSQYELPS